MALSDFEVRELGDLFEQWGYPRANAGRLLRRYYNCGGEGLDGTVVSPILAARLVKEVGLRSTSVVTRREASDGTVKLLVGLGENAERGTLNAERGAAGLKVFAPEQRASSPAGAVQRPAFPVQRSA